MGKIWCGSPRWQPGKHYGWDAFKPLGHPPLSLRRIDALEDRCCCGILDERRCGVLDGAREWISTCSRQNSSLDSCPVDLFVSSAIYQIIVGVIDHCLCEDTSAWTDPQVRPFWHLLACRKKTKKIDAVLAARKKAAQDMVLSIIRNTQIFSPDSIVFLISGRKLYKYSNFFDRFKGLSSQL